MKTSSKMLFLTLTIMSTLIIMSSSNWMNMWMGLEINLMSFIPLMSESKNSFLSESSMMYFLTQSMASSIMIMAIMTSKFIFLNMMKNSNLNIIIMTSMMMKMGMPPFHLWFPEVMNKMKWNMCFMMSTWQKIGPLYIMSKIVENNKTSMAIVATTAMIGAISGLNQTSTRKIMSYSSINHLSWLMMLIIMFKESWIMYMIIYTMLMATLCLSMYSYNIMFINQMKTFSTNILDKITIIIMMMSMGGLPPFLGFLPKMMTIKYMMTINEFIILMIMVTSALITLSYYLKMSSSVNLMMSESQKWMKTSKTSTKMFMYMTSVNILFPTGMLLIFF